ncbi:MAG TPA: hypothetical protein VGE36_11880 [Roseateles sp.]
MSHTVVPDVVQTARRHRSRAVRELGMACTAHLLLFSGAVLWWLDRSGAPADLWTLVVGALLPLAALALACQSTADARQYALHMVAATLMLPLLLLFWVGSLDDGAAGAPPAAAALDAQALFNGAAAVTDADMRGGTIALLRSGRFADGSELRLSRFSDVQAARNQVGMLVQAVPAEPFAEAGRRGWRLLGGGVGVTQLLIERHGADLLEVRASDRSQALARLVAQRVPPPPEDVAPPSVEAVERWPLLTGMAAVHALVFVALITWAGFHLTRVPALHGAAVATPDELRARLLSLARPIGPFDVTELELDGARALRVDASTGPGRTHHITLHIDARHGQVRVQETLSLHGDAPLDDDGTDPMRPDARQLWSLALQATLIQPSRLADVPLRLRSRQAELPPDYALALDGEGVLTALCTLVTRSGWHWQPRLLGRHFRNTAVHGARP